MSISPFFHGDGLFSTHFLTERLPTTTIWATEADTNIAYDTLRVIILPLLSAIETGNEEDVEDKIVEPALHVLGFGSQKRRMIAAGASRHFPDFLLYASPTDAQTAFQTGKHYAECVGLLEAKRWNVVLEHPATRKERSPHLQLRDYLNERPAIAWGIVTNGNEWRLYAAMPRRARPSYSTSPRFCKPEPTPKPGSRSACSFPCFAATHGRKTPKHSPTPAPEPNDSARKSKRNCVCRCSMPPKPSRRAFSRTPATPFRLPTCPPFSRTP